MEETFQPSVDFLGGTLRPALGFSINTEGDTSKLYLDGRWQFDFHNDLFLVLGLGAAERRTHRVMLSRRAVRGAGLPSLLGPSPGTGLPRGCDPMPRWSLPRQAVSRGRQDEDHRRTDPAPGHSHHPRRGRPGVTRSAHRASTPPPSDPIRLRRLTPRPPASTP